MYILFSLIPRPYSQLFSVLQGIGPSNEATTYYQTCPSFSTTKKVTHLFPGMYYYYRSCHDNC